MRAFEIAMITHWSLILDPSYNAVSSTASVSSAWRSPSLTPSAIPLHDVHKLLSNDPVCLFGRMERVIPHVAVPDRGAVAGTTAGLDRRGHVQRRGAVEVSARIVPNIAQLFVTRPVRDISDISTARTSGSHQSLPASGRQRRSRRSLGTGPKSAPRRASGTRRCC